METEAAAPAIDDVRVRRADLHSILVDLESRIAAAAPGRESTWTDEVRTELARLADAFTEHVEATEGQGGLFEHVRRRAPRLDRQCHRLTADHATIIAELVAATAALDRGVGEAREGVLSLLAHIARHRQLGADLIYEAYAVDLGGSD
jgi:hypothetical protein